MKKLHQLAFVGAALCALTLLTLSTGSVYHGPNPAPDDGGWGNLALTHGPNPAPDDGGWGNLALNHGPNPAPDDGGWGNLA